jgi:hypothetical protein
MEESNVPWLGEHAVAGTSLRVALEATERLFKLSQRETFTVGIAAADDF